MSDFKVIVLLSIMVISLLIITAQFPQVFGISRSDIDSIKSEINSLELRITELDVLISEHKVTMKSNEDLIKSKREELRKAKEIEGKSWTGTELVIKKQTEYDESVQTANDSRQKYLSLLREKSDAIKRIKELNLQTKEIEKQLLIENRPNTSNLIKIIGVDLSQGCITQIKANLTTDCPTYLDLRSLDSSKQEISGYFKKENGYYERDNPILQNSWRFYDKDPTPRIIIDPPNGMGERIRLITIQDNFDTYLLPDSTVMKQNYVILNNTSTYDGWGNSTNYSKLDKSVQIQAWDNTASRIIYHDRYVDEYCKHAVINADKWLMLLPDTIDYMRNNCDESHTSFNHKEIVIQNLTNHDITTSQKYKDEQRLKYIKEFCIFKYKACTT